MGNGSVLVSALALLGLPRQGFGRQGLGAEQIKVRLWLYEHIFIARQDISSQQVDGWLMITAVIEKTKAKSAKLSIGV